MFRFLRLILFSCLSVWLVFRISAELSWPIELRSFLLGVLAAALVGFAEFQINAWWTAVTKPYQPLTVKIETKETPSQVTSAATTARIGSALFLVAATFGSLYVVNPSVPAEVWAICLSVAGGLGFLAPMIVAHLSVKPTPKAEQ